MAEPTSEPKSSVPPEVVSEPEASAEPQVSAEPETVSEPKVTGEPEGSAKPEVTAEPEGSANPEVTSTPEIKAEPEGSATPEGTSEPGASVEPEVTGEPEGGAEPETTAEPEGHAEPEVTSEPEGGAEPEGTSEPEATGEPEGSAEPRGEPESAAGEPEVTSEPESQAAEAGWPEPEPEWSKAWTEWGVAWYLHVYIFAFLFALIAVLALLLVVVTLFPRTGSKVNRTTVALNLMVAYFTMTRALVLFMDPYSSSRRVVSFEVSQTIWSMGLPGFTASFSLVFLILLDTTKMSLAPPRFQKLSTILLVTLVHFAIVVIVDVVVLVHGHKVKFLLLFCQLLFILYGLILALGFAYVGYMIRRNLGASSSVKDEQTSRLARLWRLIIASSVVAFAVSITYLYAASSQFGVFSDVTHVDAWSWWGLNTCLRVEELVACFLVLSIFIRASPTATLIGYFRSFCARRTCPEGEMTSHAGAGPDRKKAFLADHETTMVSVD